MDCRTLSKYVGWAFFWGLTLLLAACGGAELPTPIPTLALPTSPAVSEDAISEDDVTEEAPALPTAVPTSTEMVVEINVTATYTAVPSTTAPIATATPTIIANNQTNHAVIFVESNDVLNVRSGPGVSFGIVGTLPPNANDVQITGSGQLVSGSTWVLVQRGALSGWVNGRFLTQFVADEAFCNDTAVVQLLDRLATAVANQDDAALAQLIHPERGLRVRLLWHQAETRLDNIGLLSDPTSYNWGVETGSGLAIVGTPAQIVLPRLQNDFLGATEIACNEILNGGSAGLIVLPEAHASINYYSFYRPGSEEFAGLNWGSWVVGVELWQGRYYLSTLVHYQWEI